VLLRGSDRLRSIQVGKRREISRVLERTCIDRLQADALDQRYGGGFSAPGGEMFIVVLLRGEARITGWSPLYWLELSG